MPTNLVPKLPPAKPPQQKLGLRVWYSILIPLQPFLLLGFVVGVVIKEYALSILCFMLFVSTVVWVTVLAIIYGRLAMLPQMFWATWESILSYILQPKSLQRTVVSAVCYVIPAALRTLATVPLILLGMGSEAYANKVIETFWEKEMQHFANHQQRLRRMGL